MAVLKGLKPEKVFAYFEKLCSVPHGSGNTKIISDLCVDFAKELGLKYRQEPCNNVVIWLPLQPERAGQPLLCALCLPALFRACVRPGSQGHDPRGT